MTDPIDTQVTSIADRIARAEARAEVAEAEVKRLREALQAIADGSVEYESLHEYAASDMREFARNALRGGKQ